MYDDKIFLLVKTDDRSRVTAMSSTTYITDATGWTVVDSMCGEKYRMAPSAFRLPIARPDGVYCYKLVDGIPVERTQAEMDADYAAKPAPEPTADEKEKTLLKAQIQALSERNDFLEDCVAEMASVVYA